MITAQLSHSLSQGGSISRDVLTKLFQNGVEARIHGSTASIENAAKNVAKSAMELKYNVLLELYLFRMGDGVLQGIECIQGSDDEPVYIALDFNNFEKAFSLWVREPIANCIIYEGNREESLTSNAVKGVLAVVEDLTTLIGVFYSEELSRAAHEEGLCLFSDTTESQSAR